MLFCPYCANNLTIGDDSETPEKCWCVTGRRSRAARVPICKLTSRLCPTCPYKWIITQQISMRTHLERKQIDDVLGGEDAWKNVDQTDGELITSSLADDPADCPKCQECHRAYFRQMQIRSADEPMTTF